jgi:hypothetical protein
VNEGFVISHIPSSTIQPHVTHESGSFEVTRGDGEALDGGQDARVGKSGLGADDAVGDVVLQRRVLLLLDFLNGTVLFRQKESVLSKQEGR